MRDDCRSGPRPATTFGTGPDGCGEVHNGLKSGWDPELASELYRDAIR